MRRDAGAEERENGSRPNGSPTPPHPRSPALPLRRLAWLAIALIVVWLLSMTLRPGSQPNGINLIPFHQKWPALACLLHNCRWAHSAAMFLLVDVLGNLAVFVLFGAALAVATLPPCPKGIFESRSFGRRWWWRIIAAGFLFSLSIELAQLLVPSRATDVDDVILNTLGTAVGAVIVWGLHRLTSNR